MEAKVFTVEKRKGGVAKTTTAVTLACGLAKRLEDSGGGRVLLSELLRAGRGAAPAAPAKPPAAPSQSSGGPAPHRPADRSPSRRGL